LKRFVLDASVALAWFVDRPMAPYAGRVRQILLTGGRAVVPGLWQIEVANGFVVAERRGLLTAADSSPLLQDLEVVIAQAVENSGWSVSMRQALATARAFRLTTYDAVYLDTARVLGVPLATLDRRLQDAAIQAGIELLQ